MGGSPKFTSTIDMLEDIMQASVPSHLVHSVRVGDFAQGRNPIRLTSFRSLPDVASNDGSEDTDHVVCCFILLRWPMYTL